MLGQKRQHLLDDNRIELRRRVVIEVNKLVRCGRHHQGLGAESHTVKSLFGLRSRRAKAKSATAGYAARYGRNHGEKAAFCPFW